MTKITDGDIAVFAVEGGGDMAMLGGYIKGFRKAEEIFTLLRDTENFNHRNPDTYDIYRCSLHPDAPHGFDRNASHNAGRYVCECESWRAGEAS